MKTMCMNIGGDNKEATIYDEHSFSGRPNTYDSVVAKSGQRYNLVTVARKTNQEKKIMYLDAIDAGMTRFLLNHGVERRRLVPVNCSTTAAISIEAATGIKCVIDNIDSVAQMAKEGEYACIWYDYCCTSVKKAELSSLIHAAEWHQITVCSRGQRVADAQRDLYNEASVLLDAHVHENGIYRGLGNKLNMAFVLVRNALPTKKKESVATSLAQWRFAQLLVPLSRWTDAGHTNDWINSWSSEYVVENNCLRATVVDYTHDELILGYIKKDNGRCLADMRTIEKTLCKVTEQRARDWVVA